MHILYVDGSGTVGNPRDHHFVFAGLSVFERGIYHLIKETDDFVQSLGLGPADDIELHGSPIYAGKHPPWRSLRDRERREQIICDAISLIANQKRSVTLFAIVVEKSALKEDQSPLSYAFEELCNRFNLFLRRNYRKNNERQRGLIIMDETKHEGALQSLAREFRVNGTRWGKLRNLSEVPLFANSKVSRLLQLADLVAYATWRRYEHKDGRFFDALLCKFDQEGRILHGLVHRTSNRKACYCPACQSRGL